MSVELVVAADPENAAARAARLLADAAHAGKHIVLAGGSTPRRAYELAALQNGDWSKAEIWWGDERCVPSDDERSNFRLVQESLLSRLARPPAAVHRIRVELGAERAAAEYDRDLRGVLLGLVLLGIGPDGHTASLFPDSPALAASSRRAVAAEPGLDPRVQRVTLTPEALAEAAHVVFLAVGAEKSAPLMRALSGTSSPTTPASLVRSRSGTTTAIVDRAAAAWL
jgi:6-phosphogluconolactonase